VDCHSGLDPESLLVGRRILKQVQDDNCLPSKMNKKVFFLFLFLTGIAFLMPRISVRAQENQSGFLISPFSQEVTIARDQTSIPFSIDVKNTTGSPAVFRISVLDFGTLDESGGVAFLGSSDNLKYSLASWVTLSNDTLVLAPGETEKVTGTIDNKESLSPGGHYGAVFFKIEDSESMQSGEQSPVAFDPSFASLLFVRKNGGEVYGLDLNRTDFTPGLFSLPDTIRERFQNTGNVHVFPRGTAEVTDPFGRLVSKSIINTESGIILPESFRLFPGTFFSVAPVFVPGRYTLSVNYRYDGKIDVVSRRSTFILVPPPFIGASIFGISASIIFRNKRKKHVKKGN